MPICQLCNRRRAKKSLTICAITKINNPIRSKKMVPHNAFRTNPRSLTLLAAALFGCWGGQAAAAEFGPDAIKMESMPVAATRTVQRLSGGALSHVPSKIAVATLDELGRKQALQQSKLSPSPAAQSAEPGAPKPLQIGLGRPVTLFATPAATAAALNWETGPEGRQFAALSVTAVGALGLRLGLVVDALPDSALVHFLTAEHVTVHTHTGAEIRDTLKQNLAAGDTSEQGRTFWSPVIDGEVALVVIELPADVSATEVSISAPMVSHLFHTPAEGLAAAQASVADALSPCHQDATCAQKWLAESASVAGMAFTESGLSYICTGTLLANPRQRPYFLSAEHCISSQTVASTLQTYWWYQSKTCNDDKVVDPLSEMRVGGAKLLYSSWRTDTSFMLLNSEPPATALLAGWSSGLAGQGSVVRGLHHPLNAFKKINRGTLDSVEWCRWTATPGQYVCDSVPDSSATHYRVSWDLGATQGGSSGSGLWAIDGAGKRYLIGQLTGGRYDNTCTKSGNQSDYGRFDVAYKSALRKWLSPRVVANDDLGGDGRSDLVFRDPMSGKNWVWQMDNLARPTSTQINVFQSQTWSIAAVGDYDGDGRADIYWHDSSSGNAVIYQMNGSTKVRSLPMPVVTAGWAVVGSGDLNTDGKDDVVAHNSASGEFGAWLMNGSSSPLWRPLGQIRDANWGIRGIADFDGDGTADVLWFNKLTYASGVHVFRDGVYVKTINLPVVAPGWEPKGVGDFDNDGIADVVWRSALTGALGLWIMNGTSSPVWRPVLVPQDLNWNIGRVGDYDGDGKADLFWHNKITNASVVYLMDGNTIKSIVSTGLVTPPAS